MGSAYSGNLAQCAEGKCLGGLGLGVVSKVIRATFLRLWGFFLRVERMIYWAGRGFVIFDVSCYFICVPCVYFTYLSGTLLNDCDWGRVIFLDCGIWAFLRDYHLLRKQCQLLSLALGFFCSGQIFIGRRILLLISMRVYPAFPREDDMEVDEGLEILNLAEQEICEASEYDPAIRAAYNKLFAFIKYLEELLAQETGQQQPRLSRQVFHCPVEGCSHSFGAGGAGWNTQDIGRAHVDLHLEGDLRGNPPVRWLIIGVQAYIFMGASIHDIGDNYRDKIWILPNLDSLPKNVSHFPQSKRSSAQLFLRRRVCHRHCSHWQETSMVSVSLGYWKIFYDHIWDISEGDSSKK